jgi:hypothetical protein
MLLPSSKCDSSEDLLQPQRGIFMGRPSAL